MRIWLHSSLSRFSSLTYWSPTKNPTTKEPTWFQGTVSKGETNVSNSVRWRGQHDRRDHDTNANSLRDNGIFLVILAKRLNPRPEQLPTAAAPQKNTMIVFYIMNEETERWRKVRSVLPLFCRLLCRSWLEWVESRHKNLNTILRRCSSIYLTMVWQSKIRQQRPGRLSEHYSSRSRSSISCSDIQSPIKQTETEQCQL